MQIFYNTNFTLLQAESITELQERVIAFTHFSGEMCLRLVWLKCRPPREVNVVTLRLEVSSNLAL
jgi:hypothetical protein